jgi:glyoxylase-like metal-dependent hydrolase (beta-lactamase superfamily II)/8-oxo-dGTP pyrophosphatase MutT (NUDIX family)
VPSPTPIPAAVTILHRGAGSDLKVYWVRRADDLAFLGGFWAFPGGRREEGDATLQAAAARELREETGVECAVFVETGRTVTPTWAAIRFDATYFLAEAPDDAHPDVSASQGELVAGEWIRPGEALARWASGERLTSPVVVHCLRALEKGIDGAADRIRAALEKEVTRTRLWDLAPGLGIAAVVTPTLPPATHTNCYVVGTDDAVVIDPGSPYPEEQAALDEALAGRRIKEIWVTHHHGDHIGGVAHLAARLGVPVAAHPITRELIKEKVRVDRSLFDGDVEVLPGTPERRLRAVFTPGHTPGHLCYHEETTGFVIAGDMVAGVGTIVVDPDEGDMKEYLASLDRLKELQPRALLPAHGPVLTAPQKKLDEYTRHRLWREQKVVDALAAGAATARDLVPRVYEDVPAGLHPLAERSLLAHLIKLVRDGRVHEQDGRYSL